MERFLWGLPNSRSWWTLEHIKTLCEISAYIAALVFFIYKALAGYLITGLSLRVACGRVHSDLGANDHLSISATAKKGKTGTLRLHDAQARITVGTDIRTLDLCGVERLTCKPDTTKWRTHTRRKVFWETDKRPFLNLAPAMKLSSRRFVTCRGIFQLRLRSFSSEEDCGV